MLPYLTHMTLSVSDSESRKKTDIPFTDLVASGRPFQDASIGRLPLA
jgi:hypothetical protein